MLGMYWSDVTGIRELDRAMSKLSGRKIRLIGKWSLNRAGSSGREATRLALGKRTGLPARTIRRFLMPVRATTTRLEYRLKGKGGDISLKYFKAKETRAGVKAYPFGQKAIFSGTFIKGGKFPSRVVLNMNGHVFARSGSGRLPIKKQKSGVVLPREMVKGESAKAWQTTVAKVLPMRVIHEVKRETGKVFG